MSKLLDCLERISTNPPAPMGFGAPRGQRAPGMALVVAVSSDFAAGCALISRLVPDAALFNAIQHPDNLRQVKGGLPNVPWGVRPATLTEEAAQAYQESGCDLLAFAYPDTPVSALASEDMARVLCLDPSIDERHLRAINSMPVDALLVDFSNHAGPWKLGDLAAIGAISSRVDKYILVEVPQPPGKKELEAIRDAGVHGLVLDVGANPSESLLDLKAALQEMPRRQPRQKRRRLAVLPGSVFSFGQEVREEEEDDEDDE